MKVLNIGAAGQIDSKAAECVSLQILHKPPPVPSFFVEMIKHMQHYDCSKALLTLDYPRNSVEVAIRDAVRWFKQNSYLQGLGGEFRRSLGCRGAIKHQDENSHTSRGSG